MKTLQGKLAGAGRTDDALDKQILAITEQAAAFAPQDDKQPKAKRSAALNVMRQS
jgi:hypothetical protein